MDIFRDAAGMRAWSRAQRRQGLRVGLVPTMGYLHAGHLSLIEPAKARCDRVVASIYVNPTQFGPNEDFDTYPRDVASDLAKLQAAGVAAVFTPSDLYVRGPAGHDTWVLPGALEQGLCGASRPGFFRGVCTVVTKLFHIVEPDVAVFGKKDYQQWRIISTMVRDLDFPIEIVGMPIVREPDGLAMSSRNARLDPDARRRAVAIPSALTALAKRVAEGEVQTSVLRDGVAKSIEAAGGSVDYISVVDQHTLDGLTRVDVPALVAVAAHFGGVRLIDNREIEPAGS